MATYIIDREYQITRQEGDHADVVFEVPEALVLDGATEVIFQVRSADGKLYINKSTELAGGVTVAGQVIAIELVPEDTKRRAGAQKWELQVTVQGKVYTIGRGVFLIVNELIA